jgi:hypothetical protein
MDTIGGNQSFPLWQIWSKPLSTNKHAVLLINLSPNPRDITVNLASLKWNMDGSSISVYDVWTVRYRNGQCVVSFKGSESHLIPSVVSGVCGRTHRNGVYSHARAGACKLVCHRRGYLFRLTRSEDNAFSILWILTRQYPLQRFRL